MKTFYLEITSSRWVRVNAENSKSAKDKISLKEGERVNRVRREEDIDRLKHELKKIEEAERVSDPENN